MKKLCFAAAALGAAALASPAFAQVGVSVNIGEPGFYGQLNIGDFPQPQVIYSRPVIIDRVPESYGPPVYLRVPPGHEKHWDRHCAEYHACGHQVYFVRDNWYRNVYAPHYRHGDHGGDRHDHDEHGHGHGHGDHGHGHDHGHHHD